MSRESSLLGPDDRAPVLRVNTAGSASFLLLGDHAGNRIPAKLGSLGLRKQDLERHIAWDIGVFELGCLLAHELDAMFITQVYSRLVVDCNRDPGSAELILEVSDGSIVPGNEKLPPEERSSRLAQVHEPYHQAIAAELERRDRLNMPTIVLSLHSFTPAMGGRQRPWQIGVLYGGGDRAFATELLRALEGRGDLVVGDNEPYAMDSTDYTVPRHAYPARRRYAELELRQDELASPPQVQAWCAIIREALGQSRS